MSSSSESSAASTGSSGLSAEAEAAEGRRRAAWFQAVDEREAQKAREAAAREGPPSPADPPQATVEAPVAAFDFDEAAVFGGERAGFVFRTGPNGLGYYRDAPSGAAPPPSASAELFGYLDANRAAPEPEPEPEPEPRVEGGLRLADLERVADGLLGSGAQASVHLYRHPTPPSGFVGELQYAVKIVKKAGLSERAAARVMAEKEALTAINTSWAARPQAAQGSRSGWEAAPPVIRLHGTDQDAEHLYLIQEYLSKGMLTSLAPLSPPLARYYLAAIALAVDASHAAGYLHRDIKLDNVMLDGAARARLCDFGLCKQLGPAPSGERCRSMVGTAGCVAPEVLAAQPYGYAADWWGVGVAGYHLLAGAPPHDPAAEGAITGGWGSAANRAAVARWVARLHEPMPSCRAIQASDDERTAPAGGGAEPLLRALLDPSPNTRLGSTRGLAELKEHEWFAEFDWRSLEEGTLLPPQQTFELAIGGTDADGGDAFADF